MSPVVGGPAAPSPAGSDLAARPRRRRVGAATARWASLAALPWAFGLVPARAAEFQFWHALSGRHTASLMRICQGFNAAQSEHRVDCLAQGSYGDLTQKVVAAYRAKAHPALAMMPDFATAEMLASGAIVPVGDLFARAGRSADWSDYLPSVLDLYRTDSGVPASLPFNVSTLVVMADRTRLAAIGLSATPDTWEGLFAAAAAMKAAGDRCPLVIQTDHAWRLLAQTSAVEGAAVATGDNGFAGLAIRYVFDIGPHRRLMDELRQAQRRGFVVGHLQTRAGKATQAFATGECAMSLESTASFATVEAVGTVDLVVGLVPVHAGEVRHNTITGGASLWALKGFEAGTEAGVAAFLAYLQTPEIQVAFAKATGYLPLTRTAARLFLEGVDPAAPAGRIVATASRSLSEPGNANSRGLRLGSLAQVFKAWGDEVSAAFGGEGGMGEALVRARRRADALADRFARTYPAIAADTKAPRP